MRRDAAWALPALVLLLLCAYLLPGLVNATSGPHRITVVTDAIAALAAAAGVAELARRRMVPRIPLAVAIYLGAAVLACIGALLLVGSVPAGNALVSLRNLLVGPVLALTLACLLPPGPRPAKVILLTVLGLAALEFMVGGVQALILGHRPGLLDTDSLTATLETSANWAVGMAVVMGSCIALAIGLVRGRLAVWSLLAAVLPFLTLWAVVKGIALTLPFCGAAVLAGYALRFGRPHVKQIAAVAAATLVPLALILAGYAHWYPDSYSTLVDSKARSHYLKTGDLTIPVGSTSRVAALATPGRATQVHRTWHLISGSPDTLLLGRGVGAASYAAALGSDAPLPRFEDATYIDGDTLLAETGLVGMVVVACAGLALLWLPIRSTRGEPPADMWSDAAVVAWPAIIVLMTLGAIYATPMRESAISAAFWTIGAIVLRPALRRRPILAAQ